MMAWMIMSWRNPTRLAGIRKGAAASRPKTTTPRPTRVPRTSGRERSSEGIGRNSFTVCQVDVPVS